MYKRCSFGEPIPPLFLGWWMMTIPTDACRATSVAYLFVGSPGAGTTTQARMLCEGRNIPFASVDELLRSKSDLAPEVLDALDNGGLPGDEATLDVVVGQITQWGRVPVWCLDGFPTTKLQAERICTLLSSRRRAIKLVFLNGPTLVDRLSLSPEVSRRRVAVCRQNIVPTVAHLRDVSLAGRDVEVIEIRVGAGDSVNRLADTVESRLMVCGSRTRQSLASAS